GLVPIMLNNISVYGMDPLFAILVAHSFALSGAVLAVWIRTKNSKLTALSGPAFLSGFFGISEPALYGIALPLKRPLIFSVIASGVAGAILGGIGSKAYAFGGLGIFQFPMLIDSNSGLDATFWGAAI